MDAENEKLCVICAAWDGYSHDAHRSQLGLFGQLARRFPSDKLLQWSQARKPTAELCNDGFGKAIEYGCDWVLWLEDDVVVPADLYDRLRACADPDDKPVVSALAFFRQEPYFPSLFRCDEFAGVTLAGLRPVPMFEYPKDELIQVYATGMCALLVHTSVFAKIAKPWFSQSAGPDVPHTPDGWFMYQLSMAGIPVHAHTGIQVGHETRLTVTEDVWEAWLAKFGADEAMKAARQIWRQPKAEDVEAIAEANRGEGVCLSTPPPSC